MCDFTPQEKSFVKRKGKMIEKKTWSGKTAVQDF